MKLLRFVTLSWLLCLIGINCEAQVNTDQVMRIGQNALYFEDYMLSIQYFNQVIAAKPYLAQPYFYRAIAKLNLDDFQGAEIDAAMAIEHNPFIVDAYEVRGVARQNQGKLKEAVDDYAHALSLLPENKNILFNKAMAQMELGDTAAAHGSYNELVKSHPSYDNGYIGRARLLTVEGDTVGALADLNHAITINPNATNAYVMRADIAINSGDGDYKSALADMDQAIKLQPRHAGLFINRAFLRYKLDDYFGAMADYDYALQLDPLNVVALFNRGLMRAELKDDDRAIRDFSQVLKLKPGDTRSLYNRAILYRDTRQFKSAIDDIDKVIEAHPDLAGAYYLRFDINRALGNTRQAERDYNKSMALAKLPVNIQNGSSDDTDDRQAIPDDNTVEGEPQEVVAARFSALLTVDNSSEALEQQYNNPGIRGKVQDRNMAVEIEPMFALSYYYSPSELRPSTYYIKEVDDLNSTRILRKLLMITNNDVSLTDQDEIDRQFSDIEYYNSYISTHAPRAIDYFGRGMAQMTVRNYTAAIADFDRALQLTPDFALALLQRGIARYRDLRLSNSVSSSDAQIPSDVAAQLIRSELMRSVDDIDRVIALSPSMSFAYYDKGNLMVEMQDYTSALSAYTQAIEAKPDFGEAYYNRGYVYLKLGNKEAGTRDLSKAGELGVLPSYNLLKRMRD